MRFEKYSDSDGAVFDELVDGLNENELKGLMYSILRGYYGMYDGEWGASCSFATFMEQEIV